MKLSASLLTFALFSILPASATSISISPANLTTSSKTFSLNVDVSDVVDLYAFQFNIQFRPDLLAAISVTEGGFLAIGGSTIFIPGTIDNSAGFVRFAGDTLVGPVSGVAGTGTLATLNFDTVSPGTGSVTVFSPTLLDSQLFSISGDPIAGSSVSIQTAAIPEPQTGTLILLALGAILISLSIKARLRGKQRERQLAMKIAGLLVCATVVGAPLCGATFTVNSTADVHDATAGDGICATGNLVSSGDPECTLRAAIEESNAAATFPPPQINLSSATYLLTIAELDIRHSLTIRGRDSDSTIIDGGNRFKVIQIFNSGTNPIVNILNLTLQRGSGSIDFGTGLFNDAGSSLYLSGAVVRDNRSAVGGVGITNAGVLTITRSTIRDNQITGGGGGVTGTGAGIFTLTASTTNINESTISGNQGIRGGGISNQGQMNITNSTIAGNIASAGGGIRNTGELTIAFSTITNNEAGFASGEPLANRFGGGILNFSHVSMGNSILAGNRDNRVATDPLYAPDCQSADTFGFTSFRGNLVGIVNENCSFRDTIFGAPPPFDTVGTEGAPVDARFAAFLDYNGGLTRTFAVVSGSLAIENGVGVSSATFFDCPRTDQRGYLRPVDGDLDGVAKCDAGAFEFAAVPPADVNADGVIDCADIALVRASFGSYAGEPAFNLKADLNGDKVVDMNDLALVSQKLSAGMTCP